MRKWVGGRRMNVALNVERLEEVKYFKYLGSKITVHGEIETSEISDQCCRKGVGRNEEGV